MRLVWAPFARTIELVFDETEIALTKDQEGWWHSPRELLHGEDYMFRVDGKRPLPGPALALAA